MKTKFTKEELLELEAQLSNPTGKKGIEVAKKMHESNFSMTKTAIDLLNIQPNSTILEIGQGSCEHLSYVLNKAKDISYTGLEISETMQKVAQEKVDTLVTSLTINFDLYNGHKITYPANSFDYIFTVNTIYFWEDPLHLLNQISAILKSHGTFIVAFASKNFMEKLPFVKNKFKLYNKDTFERLIESSDFLIEKTLQNKEEVLSKTNEKVNRDRLFFVLKKQ